MLKNQNSFEKKLSRSEMKALKGGLESYGSIIWRCLYTLGGKFGTIYYECSATDPSAPNYYCNKTDQGC
jgi:hypothetical protein